MTLSEIAAQSGVGPEQITATLDQLRWFRNYGLWSACRAGREAGAAEWNRRLRDGGRQYSDEYSGAVYRAAIWTAGTGAEPE